MEIKGLKDELGNIVKEWKQMATIAVDFFSNILTTKDMATEASITMVLEKMKKQVAMEDRKAIDAPLTLGVIHVAAMQLGKNKSLGENGVLIEFFIEFWE